MSSPGRLFSLFLALIPASLLLLPLNSLAATDEAAVYKGEFKGEVAPKVKVLDDGLYIGIALGYDSYRVRTNIGRTFNGDTVTSDPAVASTGFAGGIFGGYGQYFKDLFYLGGEGFVNITGASTHGSFSDSNGGSNYNDKVSAGTSFGAALLPGLKVNASSLFYLRLGYTCANLEGQENLTVGGSSSNTDSNHWQSGFAYGLGVETAIYQKFSLRGEYTHTYYNSFNSAFNTVYRPWNNQFMVGLIYHVY